MSHGNPLIIRFKCPLCDGTLEAPAEMAGELITCPHCQGVIEVKRFEPPKPTVADRKSRPAKIVVGVLCGSLIAITGLALLVRNVGAKVFGEFAGGAVMIVVSLVVGLFALLWIVCLILIPIFIYLAYKKLVKIEENTRREK